MNIRKSPTEAELEILLILWQHEPCTVRMVYDRISRYKKLGYTTTLKLMQIMHTKDLLSRTEDNRKHFYVAKIKKEDFRKAELKKLIANLFDGSSDELIKEIKEGNY
jgi:predicted transcriptional regulator